MSLKRILKILDPSDPRPECDALLFSEQHMIATNAHFAIRYDAEKSGAHLLMETAGKIGEFAIPHGTDFIKALGLLENVTGLRHDGKASTITVDFATARNRTGELTVPILTGDELIGHFRKFHDKKAASPMECLASFWLDDAEIGKGMTFPAQAKDVSEFISRRAGLIWGEKVGLYLWNGRLASFDYDLLLCGEIEGGEQADDWFLPQSVIDFGIDDYHTLLLAPMKDKPDAKLLHLVGDGVQGVCMGAPREGTEEIMTANLKLQERFDAAKLQDVTLDWDQSSFKRARHFGSDDRMTVCVREGKLFFSAARWEEEVGEVQGLKDMETSISLDVLLKWGTATTDHQIAIDGRSGKWYLRGRTVNGLDFYAILTTQDVVGADADEDADTDEDAEDIDAPKKLV